MPEAYYLDKLYPFQDQILKIIETLGLDFYLTGGTALGRCYLHHRYSDDLDFFVNNHNGFKKQCTAAIDAVKMNWDCDIATTSDSFVRIFVEADRVVLKIDFVNDIPSHFGDIVGSPLFHRVDNWRNILSNKLCALSRLEAKDIVDILFIGKKYPFEWENIIDEGKEKDLWVDPIEICRIISQFPIHLIDEIKWIIDVNTKKLKKELNVLHDDIFSGNSNSLFKSV
jgi:hypothetical protein